MAGQVLARRQTSTTLDTNVNRKIVNQSKNRNNEYDNDNDNSNNDDDNNYTNSIARMTHQTPRSQVTSIPSATRISTEHKIMGSAINPNRRRSGSSSNERNYMYSDNRNQNGSTNNADNRKGIERDSLLANGSALKSRSRNI